MDMDGEKLSYSISEFCARNCISRSLLYELWAAGDGPDRMRVGRRTLISAEAASAWRAQLTEKHRTIAKAA
jgi:hypothetical protein